MANNVTAKSQFKRGNPGCPCCEVLSVNVSMLSCYVAAQVIVKDASSNIVATGFTDAADGLVIFHGLKVTGVTLTIDVTPLDAGVSLGYFNGTISTAAYVLHRSPYSLTWTGTPPINDPNLSGNSFGALVHLSLNPDFVTITDGVSSYSLATIFAKPFQIGIAATLIDYAGCLSVSSTTAAVSCVSVNLSTCAGLTTGTSTTALAYYLGSSGVFIAGGGVGLWKLQQYYPVISCGSPAAPAAVLEATPGTVTQTTIPPWTLAFVCSTIGDTKSTWIKSESSGFVCGDPFSLDFNFTSGVGSPLNPGGSATYVVTR